MRKIAAIVTVLFLANFAVADLCPKCSDRMFTCDIGTCRSCSGDTSSGAFTLCRACSAKQGKCQACLAALAAATTQPATKPADKPADEPAAKVVAADQDGKTVEVAMGQKLIIRLSGNMTTGFAWTVAKIEGDAVKLVGKIEYEQAPARGRVGVGGTFVATFEPVKVGQSVLTLEYKRPWEKNTPPAKTFTLTVQVKASALKAAAESAREQERLQTSKAAWLKLKAASGGNYEYDVKFQSWVGFGQTTTIVAKEGKVVQRRLEKFNRNQVQVVRLSPDGTTVEQPQPKPEGWTESADALGSHGDGAAAKSIDELYDDAQKVLAVGVPEHGKLYVAYYPNGVLQHCFWVDTRIADDVPRHGPIISALRMGQPANP
ncbi:MAG: protease inhibitor I42 family protein [Planctomycetaceae bacterium]|nr:protease inhibitor I42 family protein [Planctomycetaceae bacterium]